MRKWIAVIAVMIMCLALAGCGGTSGYGPGEQFQLGDNTYALEKVVRAVHQDMGSTECYGVSILQVGNTAPVVISGLGNGSMNTTSAIDLILGEGEETYSARSVRFEATDEVEGYGSRVVFYFDLPVGASIPPTATLTGSSEEETARLDLTGMTSEVETTTTTATTVDPTISVDPNYDPDANKDIGNTDVYDPIESIDVNTPDTDF